MIRKRLDYDCVVRLCVASKVLYILAVQAIFPYTWFLGTFAGAAGALFGACTFPFIYGRSDRLDSLCTSVLVSSTALPLALHYLDIDYHIPGFVYPLITSGMLIAANCDSVAACKENAPTSKLLSLCLVYCQIFGLNFIELLADSAEWRRYPWHIVYWTGLALMVVAIVYSVREILRGVNSQECNDGSVGWRTSVVGVAPSLLRARLLFGILFLYSAVTVFFSFGMVQLSKVIAKISKDLASQDRLALGISALGTLTFIVFGDKIETVGRLIGGGRRPLASIKGVDSPKSHNKSLYYVNANLRNAFEERGFVAAIAFSLMYLLNVCPLFLDVWSGFIMGHLILLVVTFPVFWVLQRLVRWRLDKEDLQFI